MQHITKAFVSIIVPVYNTGDVLLKCVESILMQTYQYWELIIVDDGSQKYTSELCDVCAAKDKRIHVIHKNNEGVSATRNRGLNEVKGEWILFVDADDYVSECYIEKLIESSDADLVLCGFRSSCGLDVKPEDNYWEGKSLNDGVNYLVKDKYLLFTPWCKLFKTSIIKDNDIRFDTSLRLSEDTVFCYQYLNHVNSARTIHYDGYYYDGIWGGGKKYNLTLDEVLLLEKAQVTSIININKRFHCDIDYKYKGYRYSQIQDWYKRLTLRSVYNYYSEINDNISWKEFQTDATFNLLYSSFDALVSSSRSEGIYQTYKYIKRFYNSTCLGTTGLSGSIKLFAFLMNCHLHLLNRIYLKTYSILAFKNKYDNIYYNACL